MDQPANFTGDQPATTPKPEFGLKDRAFIQLFFDTQPKKKKAYLKQIGFEMNPDDDNEIKPIGSNDPWIPIDPGGFLNFSQYRKGGTTLLDHIKRKPDGTLAMDSGAYKAESEGIKEFRNDMMEAFVDTMAGGAIELGGQIGGGIAAIGAGVTTAGAGAAPGYWGGRSAGRALTFNMIESIKDHFADEILKENIPIDGAIRMMQTTVQSALPEVIGKAGPIVLKKTADKFHAVSQAARNMMNLGDGKISDIVWDKIKANPTLYASTEYLRSAKNTLDEYALKFRGSSSDGKGNPDFWSSIFGDKMTEFEKQRIESVTKLSQDPNASVRAGDIYEMLMTKSRALMNKSIVSDSDAADAKWLADKAADFKKNYTKTIPGRDALISRREAAIPEQWDNSGYTPRLIKPGVPEKPPAEVFPKIAEEVVYDPDVRLPFNQVDDIIKTLQSDVFPSAKNPGGRPGLEDFIGEVNNKIKAITDKIDPNYSIIKAKERALILAHNKIIKIPVPQFRSVLIGAEKIKPTEATAESKLTDAISSAGNALEIPTLLKSFEDLQAQDSVWQAIETKAREPGGFGKMLAKSFNPLENPKNAINLAVKTDNASQALSAGAEKALTPGVQQQLMTAGSTLGQQELLNRSQDASAPVPSSIIPTEPDPNSTPVPPKEDGPADFLSN